MWMRTSMQWLVCVGFLLLTLCVSCLELGRISVLLMISEFWVIKNMMI